MKSVSLCMGRLLWRALCSGMTDAAVASCGIPAQYAWRAGFLGVFSGQWQHAQPRQHNYLGRRFSSRARFPLGLRREGFSVTLEALTTFTTLTTLVFLSLVVSWVHRALHPGIKPTITFHKGQRSGKKTEASASARRARGVKWFRASDWLDQSESGFPRVAGSPAVLQTGHYEIRNKAYDGQLVAFYRNELIVVLNNATIPKSADQGKVSIRVPVHSTVSNSFAVEDHGSRSEQKYSISNVGLGVALFPNDDNFLVAGKEDILFSVKYAGDKVFVISNADEEDQFWTLYSFCEAEVHLDPALDDDQQRWEFTRLDD
ncbi:hypothetical protein DFH06DRAFT_1129094 [Mycena polygramma]|nr:hypothetical protein DFH06DRAFT_1129094 [Mycena polygramma]